MDCAYKFVLQLDCPARFKKVFYRTLLSSKGNSSVSVRAQSSLGLLLLTQACGLERKGRGAVAAAPPSQVGLYSVACACAVQRDRRGKEFIEQALHV